MAKSKKRKKTSEPAPMTPQRYIKEKGRSLPIIQTLIGKNWRGMKMASIFVARRMPSGNLVIASYLVDLLCLGVKNTMYMFNLSDNEWRNKQEVIAESETLVECSYALAHNIIYGAIEFAEDAGFQPQKDFTVSKYLLEVDDGIDPEEDIEFGENGVHHYIPGPDDHENVVLNTLNRTIGKGNYLFTRVAADHNYFEDDEDDD